ncbi:MAG: hypothetical protein K2W95_23935 [Candidatus Obscuribacterales bacterium]|nr:hypothetical protein [Candidatus Obscuribacterales bacterium]
MQNHKRIPPALVATALAAATPLKSHAQESFTSFPQPPSEQPPQLQGATMGTIGPQGGDATVIQGVMTAGTVRAMAPGYVYVSPEITDLASHYMAVPLVAFALFLFVRRNRASIWEMGIASSLILGTTGILFGSSLFGMYAPH